MFTEKILQTTEKPVVFAEQKMTVPTERLVRVLKVAEALGLSLVNLTYLGAPFVDPAPGDFNLLKPQILTEQGLRRPSVLDKNGGRKLSTLLELRANDGILVADIYRYLAKLRAEDFTLSLEQIRWLLDPQEFDMTNFYLQASGKDRPTKESVAGKYLPAYYQELAATGIPLIADDDNKSKLSRELIDSLGVKVIDLPDFDPRLTCATSPNFSQRSYIDLSNTSTGGLR